MSMNHDSNDQAEILRKRMEEKENQIESNQLPPRSEVHRNKDKKVKFRFRFPLIRLLALTFILIVCIVASSNLWKDHIQLTNGSESQNDEKHDSNIDVFEMKDVAVEEKEQVEKIEEEVEEVEEVEKKNEKVNEVEVQDVNEAAQPTETQSTPNETITAQVQDAAKGQSNNNQTEKVLHHKVKAGETLYRISMKYYKSRAGEEIIKKTNGLDANGTVMTGQILKIPLK